MAKKTVEDSTNDARLAAIKKKYGADYYVETYPTLERLPTGNLGIDRVLGGGLPRGRIMQLYGENSTGKTAVALRMCRGVQEAGYEVAYCDAERTLEFEYVERLGVKLGSRFHYLRPAYGEQALEWAMDMANLGCALVVVDSVPFLRPKAITDEADLEKMNMAPVARLLSNAQALLVPAFEHSNSVLLFNNQTRAKIGTYGTPMAPTGGQALGFMTSIALQIRRKEFINDGEGIRSVLVTAKNKTHRPRLECELEIYSATGVSDLVGMKEAMIEQRLVTRGGSWYSLEPSLAAELGIEARLGQGEGAIFNLFEQKPEAYELIYNRLIKSGDAKETLEDVISED